MNLPSSIAAARLTQDLARTNGTTSAEFQFKADDPVFAGHFPGRPLLPGVFQIEMARAVAQWALQRTLNIREISRAKFVRPILPEEIVRVDLTVTEIAEGTKAHARFTVAGQPAGETTLLLCPGA